MAAEAFPVSNQSTQVDTPQISYTFHPGTPGGKYHARMNGTIFKGATSLSSHASALYLHPHRQSSLADPAYSPLRLTLPVGGQKFTQSSLSGPTGQIDVTVVRVDARFDFSNVQSTLEVVNTVTGFSSGVQKQIFDFLTASYSTSNVTLDPGSWKVRANFTSNRPANPGTFMAYSDEFFVVADGQSGCPSGSGANTNAGHRARDFAALRISWISTLLWVPLDYSDPTVGTAVLAVIRLPANVSAAEYRGPVLFNPGGPGGSGVESLVENGPSFQVLFGDPRYDFVSFDPRGVRFSTPIASFFETDAERALWDAGSLPDSLNSSSNAIPNAWGRAHLLGTLAAQRDASHILKYLTTDNVARDMLLITQKFGFEKLKYYLWSLDKIERIIIDGVVDPDAWFSGKRANLTIEATDADKALQTFFDGCAAAGPDLCAFYKPTAAEIADRLSALTDSVRAQPVPVIAPTGYGLVDYSRLRETIFNSLSDPYVAFPTLAQGLAALENGDGSTLFSMLETPPFQCDCSNSTTSPPADDSTFAIECGDAAEVTDSIAQFTEFYQNAAKTSQFVEFLAGANRITCAGWQVYREDRFKGPVGALNTSFPLLLVTTTADPLSPKAAALNTLAKFPGSVLLTQDSGGHTSTRAPSLCTIGLFRQYIVNGTLPPPGTVCPVALTLFEPPANSTTKRATQSADDERVLAALKVIGDSVRPAIKRKIRRVNKVLWN
ncbi:TAP-like protein-domain-containing protein [Mycena capillaripes]|nr:TAP-like protein-domain-containing protein [Mycena capillaripes]